MATTTLEDTGLRLSANAADKISSLLEDEDNTQLNLRVSITGGGCSGFQYAFSFDDVINDDDTIVEKNTSDGKEVIKMLVDCMSIQYLDDAEIDYAQNIQGEQFIIRNPNAKTTCGCGSSFSIEEDDDE